MNQHKGAPLSTDVPCGPTRVPQSVFGRVLCVDRRSAGSRRLSEWSGSVRITTREMTADFVLEQVPDDNISGGGGSLRLVVREGLLPQGPLVALAVLVHPLVLTEPDIR